MKVVMRMVMAGLLLAACGGGDDDDTADRVVIDVPDASGPLPDAPVNPQIDAEGPHVCLTEADFGAATFAMQQAASNGGTPADPDNAVVVGTLNADQLPDLFQLELYKGFGVFSMNIHTGTFAMTGQELDYATCGVCPRIFTDVDLMTGNGADQQYYVAEGSSGGSVTLTSITPNLTGSVSNLQFEEVTVNPSTFESTPVPGGCTTAVMSGAFDVANTHMP